MKKIRGNLKNIFKIIILSLFFVNLFGLSLQSASDKEDELFFVAQKAFEDGFYDVSLSYLDKFLADYPQTAMRPKIYLLQGKCFLYQSLFLKAIEKFQAVLNMPEAKDIYDAAIFWTAEVHFKGEDYKLASEFYKKLINEYPASEYIAYAYYSLGFSLLEQADHRRALENFNKLIDDYPKHELIDEAVFKKAESLYNLQMFKEADDAFNAYIKKFPKKKRIDSAYFYLGESNYYQNEFSDVIKNYEKAFELSANNKVKSLSKTGAGWSWLKLYNYDESKLCFESAKAISLENKFSIDLILLGEATLESEFNYYEKALFVYQEIIDTSLESPILIDAYLGKANSLYELGKAALAIPVYEKILQIARETRVKDDIIDEAYFGLAWSYLKLKKPNEAIANLQIIEKQTKNRLTKASALVQIADTYEDIGRLEQALETYDTVLTEYQDTLYSDYVQYQEGIVLLKLDKTDAATIAFQSLKTNFPNSKYIIDSGYYLALAYFKKGNFSVARSQLEDLMNSSNSDSEYKKEAMFLLGMTLCELGEYRSAINNYRLTIKYYRGSEDLVQRCEYEIANCLFRMGDTAEAVKKFKIIVYKYPQTEVALNALDWLGNYYKDTESADSARKYFQRIIDEFSDSETAIEAHYQIAKTYYDEARLDEALKEFNLVKEKSRGKIAALASLNIADIFSRMQKDKEIVVKEYENVIIQFPGISKQAYAELAKFYATSGDYERASLALKKALESPLGESNIEDSQIQFDMAEIREEKGEFDSAIEAYLKVTYLYPKSRFAVKAYLRVGRIFENKNEWDKAINIYAKIASENIDESKFAEERLEWITQNIKN